MRRLIVSSFILLLLMACDFSVFAQRGVYRPPPRPLGGGSVARPLPRPIAPPRFDPRTRQPIPTRPPVIRRRPTTTATATVRSSSFKVTVPPVGSPQIALARTQAKTTLAQLRTSLQARLRSSTALRSGTVKVKPSSPNIPRHVADTIDYIEKTGNAPPGYQGGRQFMNDGRGDGQTLPRATATGTPIIYREYDVNPYTRGVNRGAERIVRGNDGSVYYTANHYKTFIKIK